MKTKILNTEKIDSSKFIDIFRVNYQHNGKILKWDCAKIHDSVSTLLYHRQKDAFLLVKQLRIPVLFRQESLGENLDFGYSYELCSGLMDKGLSSKDTAIEEIYEEVGYEVNSIKKISLFYGGLGTSASKQTFFYAEICDEMQKGEGGGIDDEYIELFYLPVEDAKKFIYDESIIKPASLAFCIMWWFDKFR
ncbi:MAG: NUDIX hydrolase [Campylobacter sp.]|nr:NUDIX hydrolase [Campylobacter sp.]